MVGKNNEICTRVDLRNMSTQDLKDLGVNYVAYIKPVKDSDKELFAVYSADGGQISVTTSYEDAVLSLLSNMLEPVTIH